MSQKTLTITAILAVVGLFVLYNAAFIVRQTEQALVLQFGAIQRVEQEPGLKFKIPFVQNVTYFDKRLMQFDAEQEEFITKDEIQTKDGRVVIDAFLLYRIIDPVKFYQSVRNESNLNVLLSQIVKSNMRKIMANVSLGDLLSEQRSEIMHKIYEGINKQVVTGEIDPENPNARRAQSFGIEVVDLRIMRTDLPDAILQSTFERMRANFSKKAQRFRAEGEQQALEIRSNADRQRIEILAQARKESETIRGEGDGIAAKIYADAFNQDKEFFEFYRTMQAYKKSLNQDDTTVILSPKSEFLNLLD